MQEAARAPLEIVNRRLPEDDVLGAFKTESQIAAELRRKTYLRWVAAAVGVVALSAAGVLAVRGGGATDASLQIQSDPAGIQVRVNGELRGRTPLSLALAPGDYSVVLGEGASSQTRRVTLGEAEKSSLHYVVREDSPAAATSAAAALNAMSALSVITEPAGGAVSIDGIDRGTAPLVAEDLAPGEHRLVVRNQGGVYQRSVTLEAGVTSTVVVGTSMAAAGGWLTVDTPLPLQIHEAGGLVGLSETSRLMLTPGEHQLTLSDERTGFRVSRSVRITAGQTTTLAVEVPQSAVNFNAIPWAEVWVDGQRVGETPIGNYMLRLGNHQIELRHPQLGTKRMTLLVSASGPNRVAVNMRDR
jgi:hypothetical protein